MRGFMLTLAAWLSLATPAFAVDVASGSVSVGPADATQLGRLVRNGLPQDFSGGEAFPGVNNPTTSFAYTVISVPFAANALQDVYYDITFDDPETDLFASAYLNVYDPTDKELNWLGDAGTSGNYFGVDALFFDVVVPRGGTLQFVVNSATGTTQSSTANYFIQAFSDSEYNENFLSAPAVPEPTIWLMMFVGLGVVGYVLRRPGNYPGDIAAFRIGATAA